jgi:type 1 glutamine amidotransferase
MKLSRFCRLTCLTAVLALAGGGTLSARQATPAPAQPPTKHLLLITESKGFKHGCVDRKVTLAKGLDPANLPKVPNLDLRVVKTKVKDKDGKERDVERITAYYHGRIAAPGVMEFKDAAGQLVAKVEWSVVEQVMTELGAKNGFDVVCSQDSRTEVNSDNLKNFDAVWFYTTGELPLSETQKAELLAYVRSGKGFGGSHSATDTFYKWKEYGDLIGAYFDGHPWHQKVNVIVEDKKHPATSHLGDSFVITDEIYQFKGPYSRDKLHVLMKLDLKDLKPGKRQDNDNALAWTNQYGKGRVFYTALGHRDEVWRDPRFQQHVVGALQYLFFRADAGAPQQ